MVSGPGEQNLVDAYHVKYCFRRTIHVELQVMNSCKCSFKLVCVLGFSVVSDLCDPMDCSLPGSSVHGIFQARVLKRVAIFFSRASSSPRDQTCVSCIDIQKLCVSSALCCIAGSCYLRHRSPLLKCKYTI